jgi:hypothetical protein
MLEQNDTLERMVILLDAIIERVSANDSRVADEYPKGQSMDTGYSAHSSFRFFAKRIIFRSLFLLGCCLCVSLPSTTKGGFFQYRPDLKNLLLKQGRSAYPQYSTRYGILWSDTEVLSQTFHVIGDIYGAGFLPRHRGTISVPRSISDC